MLHVAVIIQRLAKEVLEAQLQDMINRMVDVGREYGMKINVEKSKIMRISGQPTPLHIMIQKKSKRIAAAMTAFSKKRTLFTGNLDVNLKMKLIKCCIETKDLYGLRKADSKYLNMVLDKNGED